MEWIIAGILAFFFFNQGSSSGDTPADNTPPATPQDFVNAWLPTAQLIEIAASVPAVFQISQAAEESGWGKSDLVKNANNYFGIKADKAWTGPVYNGYRKYTTPKDSWIDHASYLVTNKNYAAAFQIPDAGDPVEFATAVAGGGYATDINYLSKILDMISTVQGLMNKQAA